MTETTTFPQDTSRRILKCPKCGHEWFSKSQLKSICCPKCLRKSHYN